MSVDDSQNEPVGPRVGAVSSGDETARVVKEILEDQKERRAREAEASRRAVTRRRLLPLPLVALLWGAACLLVWAATPAFLLPEPLPEPTAAALEAGLRVEMLRLVTEIDQYREETGRVPEVLERVSQNPPADVLYTPIPPSSYRLMGERAGIQVVYEAGEPLSELRGNARRVIEGVGDAGATREAQS